MRPNVVIIRRILSFLSRCTGCVLYDFFVLFFRCDQCDMAYPSKVSLYTHVRHVHEKIPYNQKRRKENYYENTHVM